MDGAYQIRAYGINQLDPDAFGSGPGNRDFRGGVDTQGQFALNDKWVWGWDGVLLSDYFFFSDYRLRQYRDPMQSFLTLPTEAISQLYLTGVGNRSYFDARAIYYLSFSGNQSHGSGGCACHRLFECHQPFRHWRRVQLQVQLRQSRA